MMQFQAPPAPLDFAHLPPALPSPGPLAALSPASALVQLPRTLARPTFRAVRPDACAREDPALAGVPVEYVRADIALRSAEMLAAIQKLQAHLPASAVRAQLPPSVQLSACDAGRASTPTHILALCSSSKDGAGAASGACALLPTHSLVLAAACAHMGALPRAPRGAAAVPVVPLALPNPEAFAPLHAYLYHRSAPALLSSLLGVLAPSAPTASSSDGTAARRALAQTLAAQLVRAAGGDVARVMGACVRVMAVWRNVCALGVCELELWDALDCAWDGVLGALNLVAGRR